MLVDVFVKRLPVQRPELFERLLKFAAIGVNKRQVRIRIRSRHIAAEHAVADRGALEFGYAKEQFTRKDAVDASRAVRTLCHKFSGKGRKHRLTVKERPKLFEPKVERLRLGCCSEPANTPLQ